LLLYCSLLPCDGSSSPVAAANKSSSKTTAAPPFAYNHHHRCASVGKSSSNSCRSRSGICRCWCCFSSPAGVVLQQSCGLSSRVCPRSRTHASPVRRRRRRRRRSNRSRQCYLRLFLPMASMP
jgi:hypothetical protein